MQKSILYSIGCMVTLEFPNITHEEAYFACLQEWCAAEETPTSPGRLFYGNTFTEFLERVWADARGDIEPNGVPATLLFLVERSSRKILWAIQIRHHINHPNLIEDGGHIGYGIRPSERGKWYATQMLGLALQEARKLWLKRVMVNCDDNNTASARVIEKNGWVFERFANLPNQKVRRYWIDL